LANENIYINKIRELVLEQEKANELNKEIKKSLISSIIKLKSLDR
jgi:hypothetical protein